MIDLNLFRALEQSRRIVEEEFAPRVEPRLASEVIGANQSNMPHRIHIAPAKRARIHTAEVQHGH